MRNLKRALSLGLASVMLMGMMVVGAGAKGIDGYKDKDEIVNKDAVAVTSEIGIFAGYEDGSFGGDRVVTRAEMAVIICKILYGAGVKVDQFTESQVFTDVPAWAAGYVNLCASMNIVAGVGNNQYDPSSTVTTSQAALMLAKALGYFKNESDYGNSWMLAATATGTKIGLYDGLSNLSATAGLTRNDVAVMTFNALTNAVPVEYNEVFGVYYSAQGNLTAGVVFNYLDTLGYQNFDLVYQIKDDSDDFGRPGTVWGTGSAKEVDAKGNLVNDKVTLLAKNEIVTVAEEAEYVYTAPTKENVIRRNVGAELCGPTSNLENWTLYVDGDLTTVTAPDNDPDTNWSPTASRGFVTEIYISNDDTVTVVRYGYYLTDVSRVRTDSDGRYITVSAAGVTLDDRDFYTDDFDLEDNVIITRAFDGSDYYVASVIAAPYADGELTGVDGSATTGFVELDGKKINYSKAGNAVKDLSDNGTGLTLGDDYRVYLDPNGFVVGYDKLADSVTKYAYVKNVGSSLGDYTARLVLADGSEVRVDISDDSVSGNKKLENNNPANDTILKSFVDQVVKYTVSSKDVYTLTVATKDSGTFDIKNDDRNLYAQDGTTTTGSRFNDSTVFVDMDNDKVYKGYKNVPSYDDAKLAYAVTGSSTVEVVFITEGTPSGDKTFFYLTGNDVTTRSYDGSNYNVYTKATVNGEPMSLWVLASVDNGDIAKGKLFEATKLTGEIYVKDYKVATAVAKGAGVVTETGDGFFTVDGFDWQRESDTIYVEVEKDGTDYTVNKASASDVRKGVTVFVCAADGASAEVVYIYTNK